MPELQVLIVDDEPLAREGLVQALADFEEVNILGECANGFEAVKSIKKLQPDLVFLDIQMPKLNGFDVLELLEEDPPFIVFVTAYDEYALKAFEFHALDYILKPVRAERLAKTMKKVMQRLQERKSQPVGALLAGHQERQTPLTRILIRDRTHVHIIPVEDILYLEAQDDYVSICTINRLFLKKETLSHLERLLDNRQFIRIHRSYLLNINYLKKIEPYSKDSRIAILKNNKTLPVSRSGYSRVIKLI
jgi:two-component system LytT family response regulator